LSTLILILSQGRAFFRGKSGGDEVGRLLTANTWMLLPSELASCTQTISQADTYRQRDAYGGSAMLEKLEDLVYDQEKFETVRWSAGRLYRHWYPNCSR